MPGKLKFKTGSRKRTKTTTRRKTTTRKGRGQYKGNKTQVQHGYLPFNVRYNTRLPYVENYAITADGTTGLSAVVNQFSGNSVYDPRYNIGGHQPLQFDQISIAYERVWVWGTKVILTFANPSHDGMYVGYRVRASTNAVTTNGKNIEYIQEMRESKIRAINNSGKQSTTFTFYVNNPKVLGITKTQYSNVDYSELTGGPISPVSTLVEPYAIHTVNGETATVRCNIKLIYYAQFTNPITQGQS